MIQGVIFVRILFGVLFCGREGGVQARINAIDKCRGATRVRSIINNTTLLNCMVPA